MAGKLCLLLLFCCALDLSLAYNRPDLPPGPYCGIDRNCCKDRKDICSHSIMDTLCYCDEFCNRTRAHDDCCPDYEEVCLGLSPPDTLLKPTCELNGRHYNPGMEAYIGCNKCECISTVDDSHWQCEQDTCIISDDVIRGVNQYGASWRAANYSRFADKKLKDGIMYMLGTLPLGPQVSRLVPIRYDKEIAYPTHFDARQRWPGYISPVMDQGWCGSDWAVTIAGVASDRFAIQSNGAEREQLSAQTLLSCNVRQQQGCHGGHIDVAWSFLTWTGLVDEACFPYQAKVTRCPIQHRSTLHDIGCTPAVSQRKSLYRTGPPGLLKKEDDVMYDIMESGPVQAIMTVYQDFFHYRDGIYRHSQHGDNRVKGLHSVRVIGWGEDGGDKYWLVANSWGTEWGENGYFRIARGSNESGIESFVITALSEVTEAYQKK